MNNHTTYTPTITEGFMELVRNRPALQQLLKDCTHLKTKEGDVRRLQGKQSICPKTVRSLPAGSSKPKSISYRNIESFGVLNDSNSNGNQTHAGRNHALLSASAAHRWLHCTPSARLEATKPDTSSEAAMQGTAAHELAEHKLRNRLGLPPWPEPTSKWVDQDMHHHTDDYVQFVSEMVDTIRRHTPDAQVLLEHRLDFSRWVPGGFGTGDCVIIGDGHCTVIDFKYGAGVLVGAEDNPQMRLYALGAYATYSMLFDFDEIEMIIYQPRRGNISRENVTVTKMLEWANNTVAPAAQLAAKGEGDFQAGDWCQFCKLQATCRARADHNLELAKEEFTTPPELSDSEVAQIVQRAGKIKKWLADVEKYALQSALHGKRWPGLKVVESRSSRRYGDEQKVAEVLQAAGFEDIWVTRLKGLTAMRKLVGNKQFDDLVGGLLVSPQGKPTLAPASDKRPEVPASAVEEFEQIA